MPMMLYNGIPYGAGGDGNLSIVEKTKAEYEALSEEEKMDETKIYRITDMEAGVKFGSTDISGVGDGTVTGAIWSMNENLTRVANIHDTRSINETPAYYMEKYPRQVVWEFKIGNGLLGYGGEFVALLTIVPWNDQSGGYPKQLAFPYKNDTNLYFRIGKSDTEWSEWAIK